MKLLHLFQTYAAVHLRRSAKEITDFHVSRFCITQRCLSMGKIYGKELSIRPTVLDTIGYVDNEFCMLDYEQKKNKELFPVLPSTEETLITCNTPSDVLVKLLNEIQQNTFKKDDIIIFWKYLYFKLCACELANKVELAFEETESMLSQPPKHNSFEIASSDIFNNITFQRLVYETLSNSQNLLTRQLSCLIFYLRHINLPTDSFVFTHVMSIIKERINELFPRDVVWCLQATENIVNSSSDINAFHKGLLMHLENQQPHPLFKKTLRAGNNCNILLRLLLSPLIIKSGSEKLKLDLIESCEEIFKNNRRNRMDKYESLLVLDAAKEYEELQKSTLYKNATKYYKKYHKDCQE